MTKRSKKTLVMAVVAVVAAVAISMATQRGNGVGSSSALMTQTPAEKVIDETRSVSAAEVADAEMLPPDTVSPETQGNNEMTPDPALANSVAAAEFYRRADELVLCAQARSASEPKSRAEREDELWRWLPAEIASRERNQLEGVLKQWASRCATVPMTTSKEIAEVRESAASLGHPLAKLQARRWDEQTPELLRETRALIDEVLRSERLEDIAQLGGALPNLSRELADHGIESDLWRLVACDLGMPCERGSPAWNRACIETVGVCGTEHLEHYALDTIPERLTSYFQLRRVHLVELMRRRDYEAVLRELVPDQG